MNPLLFPVSEIRTGENVHSQECTQSSQNDDIAPRDVGMYKKDFTYY